MKKFMSFFEEITQAAWSAVIFYTIIPLPSPWSLTWERVARFAPVVGILIGSFLAIADVFLQGLNVPIVTRSALVIASGVALTGGLHLDGVIDSADGLAVLDTEKRLTVMKDSTTGAFGVIAAVIVLGLKVIALSEIEQDRWLILLLTSGWGRWGQVCAIALYPYLRPEGKGSFHKQAFQFPQDFLLGWIVLSLLSFLGFLYLNWSWSCLIPWLFGTGISLLVSGWFNWKLGGHTGDTYGAVVEWTEAFYLCVLTAF